MPFKRDASHRHHIGKMKFKVTNRPEYEAGPSSAGSLTLWVRRRQCCHSRRRSGQYAVASRAYSDLAIEAKLMLGLMFGLRLLQTEGFVTSILQSMGPDLAVPDHTTLSRRASKRRSPD